MRPMRTDCNDNAGISIDLSERNADPVRGRDERPFARSRGSECLDGGPSFLFSPEKGSTAWWSCGNVGESALRVVLVRSKSRLHLSMTACFCSIGKASDALSTSACATRLRLKSSAMEPETKPTFGGS